MGASRTSQTAHTLHEIIQRVAGLARVDRQSDHTFCHALGDRELAFPKTSLLECSSVVQRRVMRAHFDALLIKHRVDEIVLGPAKLLGIELNWIKVENMFAARIDGRQCYARH